MSVTVPCTFSDAAYRVLAGIAAAKGTQVHRLIEVQTERALVKSGAIVPPGKKPRAPKTWQRVTDDDRLSWMHMWLAGMTDTDIARQVGRGQPTVSNHLRQMGCPPRAVGGAPMHKKNASAPEVVEEVAA